MKAVKTLFFAAATFASGFVAGLLLAPHAGRESRQIVADKMRAQTRWLEKKVDRVEEQLHNLEGRVESFAENVGDRLQQTTDHYVPSLPDDPEQWHVEGEDVASDLRRMPRK